MHSQINIDREERFWHSILMIKSFALMHKTAKDNKNEIDSHVELYIEGLSLTSAQEDNLLDYYNVAKFGGKNET